MSPTDTIPVGSVGSIQIGFSGGKATVSGSGSLDSSAVQIGLTVTADATVFINQIFAAIEAKTPGAAAIEEGVKAIILAAVKAIA